MDAIKTEDLTKEFNGLMAVDHVNLTIGEGELFGLLGPNGAGKTTLLNMICTILKPTEGTAKVWEADVRKEPDKVRSSIGMVFQDPSLDDRLTGWENLDFHGRMYHVPKDERKERAGDLLELIGLKEWSDELVMKYSEGMLKRLELVRGMMHEPKVLLLDEPTLALDPQTRRKMWEYIRDLNDESGTTMILTTHYMDEADYLCDRVGIIDEGKIIALDTPERLRNGLKGDVVTLKSHRPKRLIEVLQDEDIVNGAKVVDKSLHLQVDAGEEAVPRLLEIAKEHGVDVRSAGLRKPTLEDVFIRLTGRRMREKEAGVKERMRIKGRSRRR